MTSEGAAPALDATLVSALLEARDDAATEAFDAALTSAQASGRVDSVTARELRYWQRRSLDGLIDHAAVVVPSALAARSSADAANRETAAEARLSWVQARSLQSTHADAAEPTPRSPNIALGHDSGAPSHVNGSSGLTVVTSDSVPRED